MNEKHVYIAFDGKQIEDWRGEGFSAIALSVEGRELRDANLALRRFVEEVLELAEAHPGIEVLTGGRAIQALNDTRAVRLFYYRRELAERARKQ